MITVHETEYVRNLRVLPSAVEMLLGGRPRFLLIEPGGKSPAPGWSVKTATDDLRSLAKTMLHSAQQGVCYNVAVAAGQYTSSSRLIIVDLDTEAELLEFGAAIGSPVELTVATPGKVNDAGEWVHGGGGHAWYLTDPYGDDELHSAIDELGARETWGGGLVMLRDSYALCPPSTRAEGAYHWAGAPLGVPARLREALLAMAAEKREKRNRPSAAPLPAAAASEEQWEQSTPWHELLLDSGLWVPESETASCGCDIWRYTRAANARSAVAHEPGCADGHRPFLHLFSTTAQGDYGRPAVSKLQFYAHHKGVSLALARDELGLPPWREQREIWSAKGIPATPATPAVASRRDLAWRILAGGAA